MLANGQIYLLRSIYGFTIQTYQRKPSGGYPPLLTSTVRITACYMALLFDGDNESLKYLETWGWWPTVGFMETPSRLPRVTHLYLLEGKRKT